MPHIPPDFALSSYSFALPEDRIAQHPAAERSASRLLCLDRAAGRLEHARFADIGRHLPGRSLLVVNNSRVIPARVFGQRPGCGRMEMLLLTPLPLLTVREEPRVSGCSASPGGQREPGGQGNPGAFVRYAEADALLRPAKKVRPGDRIRFADDFSLELLEKGEFGRCRVRLAWQGDLLAILTRLGEMPLPPYIKRPASGNGAAPDNEDSEDGKDGNDTERYQTVYARGDKAGSVAAPTAGLHFTDALRAELADAGHEWAEVTLYVGYGTFSPVRSEDIRDHAMHAEYVEIPEETAEAVNRAKRDGRPVIAVGTTSARTLEGAFRALHPDEKGIPFLSAFAGWTDIFLYPGGRFHVIDGLITNFHLPESSLLMLVSALAGRDAIREAYDEALASGYRFFSYGDAMLIR